MKKSKTLKYSAGDEKPAMRIDKKNPFMLELFTAINAIVMQLSDLNCRNKHFI